MSTNIYNPDTLYPMFFSTFKIVPYVYDKSFSLYEQIGQALQHVNEVIKETNDMGTALVAFEQFVASELTKYDTKIQTEVTDILNLYISNGTIADLINELLFGQINTDIANLKAKDIEIEQSIYEINYKKPSASLSINPSPLIYMKGSTINGVLLNSILVNQSQNITNIKYYKNNNVISDKNFSVLTTTDSFIDGNQVTTDTSYYVTVNDGKTVVNSESKDIKFVNPFYHGISTGLIGNANLMQNQDISLKSQKSYSFNGNDIHIFIAYPATYGYLKTIKTLNEKNIIEAFDIDFQTLHGEPYNIYYSTNSMWLDNLEIEFSYEVV